jgi:hypothetical protein
MGKNISKKIITIAVMIIFLLSIFNISIFSVSAPPVPSPSSPGSSSSPGNKISDLTPTLSWSSSTGATYYEVGVSVLSGGSYQLIYGEYVNGTSHTLPSGTIQEGKEYRWNVQAHNTAGGSGWSSRLYFYTDPGVVIPTVPSPSSPGSNSSPGNKISDLTPTLSWSSSTGATSYEVGVSVLSGGSYQLIYGEYVNGTSYTLPSGTIQEGKQYRWNVQAHNTAGGSGWSSRLYFYTEVPEEVKVIPTVPSPSSPGSSSSPGSKISDLTPTLSWSSSTGATSYEVGVSVLSGGSYQLIYGEYVNGTSYTLPSGTIQEGKQYRWNVQAHNTAGGSGWSSRLYFYTDPGVVIPTVPSPSSPGSNSSPGNKISDLTPTLSWSSSTGATSYEVGVSVLSGGSYQLIYGEYVNGTSHTLPSGTIQEGKEYRWNVQAHNTAGGSGWSSRLYFYTDPGVIIPTVPSPSSPGSNSSPGNKISDLTPTLSWSSSTGATSYEVGVSVLSGGSYQLIYGEYVNGTSYTLPSGTIQEGKQYRWNVQAHNTAGGSGWSSRLYFYTEVPEEVKVIPTVPSPSSPGSSSSPGSKISDLTPTLSWSSSTGATSYEVGVSVLSGGSYQLIYGEYVNGTSYTLPSGTIQEGKQYRWNVQAHNTAGGSGWSSRLYFYTDPGVVIPTVPSPSSPGSNSSPGNKISDLTPTLSWSSSTGATSYEVGVSVLSGGSYQLIYGEYVNGTSHTLPSGTIQEGKEYRWNVQAHNTAGGSGWSSRLYFYTDPGVIIPTVPSPSSPGSNSSPGNKISDLTPTLSWSSSTGATSYEVGVSVLSGGSYQLIYGEYVNGTSYTLPSGTIQEGKQYRWNVQAHNTAGGSGWSGKLYFYTDPGVIIPTVPSPSSPGSNSSPGNKISDLTPTLSWSSSTGATSYEVGVSVLSGGSYQLIYGEYVNGTSHTLPSGTIQEGKQYRWNVQAHNTAGGSGWSGKLYFYTDPGVVIPTVPSPSSPGSNSSPGNKISDLTPTLSWSSSTGATSYEVGVSVLSGGSYQLIYGEYVNGTSYTLPSGTIQEGKEYRWNVQAHNTAGGSGWSGKLYFYTDPGVIIPTVPSPSSPGSNSSPGNKISDLTPTLSWSSSTGATSYEVGVSVLSGGSYQLIYGEYVNGTSHTLPSGTIQEGKEYRWNVQAHNTAGGSGWSSRLYFYTDPGVVIPTVITEQIDTTDITKTIKVISAEINSFEPNEISKINLNEVVQLCATVKNTGDIGYKYLFGVTIWDSIGNQVKNMSTLLENELMPGEERTIKWAYKADIIGEFYVQFGIWKDSKTLLAKAPSTPQKFILVEDNNQEVSKEDLSSKNGMDAEDIEILGKQINSQLNITKEYPKYLINLDTSSEKVSSVGLEIMDKITKNDVVNKYVEFYCDGVDYDCLRLIAAVKANQFYKNNDYISAEKYIKQSLSYKKVSENCFKGAYEIFMGGLETAEILAKGIADGCEASVKFGISILNPSAAKFVDYGYLLVNGVIDAKLYGIKDASKNILQNITVDIILNKLNFVELGNRTIIEYTNNRVGKLTFGMIKKLFKDKQVQFTLSKMIKEGVSEIESKVVDKMIEETIKSLQNDVIITEYQVHSPVELRVYDLDGNVTGLINGVVYNEIPMSIYMDETVSIFFQNEIYMCEIVGLSDGVYGFEVNSTQDNEDNGFILKDISITEGEKHIYDLVEEEIVQDSQEIVVKVDKDGDGIIEEMKYVKKEKEKLTKDEIMLGIIGVLIGIILVCLILFFILLRKKRTGRYQ